MCAIVDANKINEVINSRSEDVKPFAKWMGAVPNALVCSRDTKTGRFIPEYTQRNIEDLNESVKVSRDELLVFVDYDRLEKQNEKLKNISFKSNEEDRDIIRLALATGAELLYTGDKALIADLKKKVPNRHWNGKFYKGATTKKLLHRNACARCRTKLGL